MTTTMSNVCVNKTNLDTSIAAVNGEQGLTKGLHIIHHPHHTIACGDHAENALQGAVQTYQTLTYACHSSVLCVQASLNPFSLMMPATL